MTLSEYLAAWDPMGFIEDLKAPVDEYNLEAAEIKLKFTANMSTDEVAKLVYKVFDELIGVDTPHFRQECEERATEMQKLLLSQK